MEELKPDRKSNSRASPMSEKTKSKKLQSKQDQSALLVTKEKPPVSPSAKTRNEHLPDPWSLTNFSEEHIKLIKAFREGPAKDYIKPDHDDLEIARWLIARKWDLNAGTKMFIDSMKWREAENIDTILDWAPSLLSFKFLLEYWPHSITQNKTGTPLRTKDGYQVIYERLTAVSPEILKFVPLHELKYFHIYLQELATAERKKIVAEKNDGMSAPTVFVQDLRDLTMSHLSKNNFQMMNSFTDCDSLNYPETVRKVYIVNAPGAWTFGWKVSKNFLDPATIEKIAILDAEDTHIISSVISPSSLLKEYGGELDFKLTGGGTIEGDQLIGLLPKLNKISLYSSVGIILFVENGQRFNWQYKTKTELTLSLYYHDTKEAATSAANSSKKDICPETDPKKTDPEGLLQDGFMIAQKTGYYTLFWEYSVGLIKKNFSYLVACNGVVLKETDVSVVVIK